MQTPENTAKTWRQQTTFERSKSLKIKRRRLSPGKRRNTHIAETVETTKTEVVEAMEYPKFSFRIAPEVAAKLEEEATNRELTTSELVREIVTSTMKRVRRLAAPSR